MNDELIFVDRHNTGSVKWDMLQYNYGNQDLQAMWIADMDFRVPECVQDALMAYMQTGVYGYSYLGMNFLKSFAQWEEKRHGFQVQQQWLRYCPGVVAGLNWAVMTQTEPGDSVMVLGPVYAPFYAAVKQNGRQLVESKLQWLEDRYVMDFEDMALKMAEHKVKMLLLCSPHNPVGRVWHRDELEKVTELCKKHNVLIVSDEIHQDITLNGAKHIPVGSLDSENVIMLTSPSKTFNLAGFYNALAIIPNERIRERWDAFTQNIHISYGNTLGYIAGEAAYRGGAEWNRAVCRQVFENFAYLRDKLISVCPLLKIPELEGTYLMWIDFGAYLKAEEMKDFFQNQCGLALNYGEAFGGDSATCVRINLATSSEMVKKCAEKIIAAMAEKRTGVHKK